MLYQKVMLLFISFVFVSLLYAQEDASSLAGTQRMELKEQVLQEFHNREGLVHGHLAMEVDIDSDSDDLNNNR